LSEAEEPPKNPFSENKKTLKDWNVGQRLVDSAEKPLKAPQKEVTLAIIVREIQQKKLPALESSSVESDSVSEDLSHAQLKRTRSSGSLDLMALPERVQIPSEQEKLPESPPISRKKGRFTQRSSFLNLSGK
jgi:hypothetical protein